MMLKAEGRKRVDKTLRSTEHGFGSCPGHFRQQTMDNVIGRAMDGLRREEYTTYGVPLLEGMLSVEEQERFSSKETAPFLQDLILSLVPGLAFHCDIDEDSSGDDIASEEEEEEEEDEDAADDSEDDFWGTTKSVDEGMMMLDVE